MQWSRAVPAAVSVGLCLSILKVSITSGDTESTVQLLSTRQFSIVAIAGLCATLIHHFELTELRFMLCLAMFISLLFPYLSKTSKHRQNFEGPTIRPWSDKLIVTSSAYIFGAMFAFSYGQIDMGLVCMVTFFGSTLYHRYREMVFFNLDNTFATSLLVVFVYTIISAYFFHDLYFRLGVLGMPVAVFLIVYCGMPAEIHLRSIPPNDFLCCVRSGRELYDTVHNLWHLASGVGPFMAVWYLDYLKQIRVCEEDTNTNEGLCIEQAALLRATFWLPYAAIIISFGLNLLGNYCGVMPLE